MRPLSGQQAGAVRGDLDKLNEQGEAEVAQLGLAQQKRRAEGRITAEQHLQENIAFIKHATEKHLKLLDERMAKE
jgi:hypothetical protein